MSIAVNQTSVGSNMTGTGVSSIAATAINQTAGHLIVVGVRQFEATIATYTQTVADTAGNSYTPIAAVAGTTGNVGQLQLFYCLNCLGHTNNIVTATFKTNGVTGNTEYVSIFVWDITGQSLTYDSGATAYGNNTSSSPTTGTFRTAFPSEISVALETVATTGAPNATSTWTVDDAKINSTGTGAAAHEVFTSVQSGITASFGVGSSLSWIIVTAGFYENIVAGGGVADPRALGSVFALQPLNF